MITRDERTLDLRNERRQDLRRSINSAQRELRAINRQAWNENIVSCISRCDKSIQEEIILILLNSTRGSATQHILDTYISA